MNSERISDIPEKVRVKNIDKSGSHMNVAGLLGVPNDNKAHDKNLGSFRPEHRQKVWESLLTMQASGLIELAIIQDEHGTAADKAPKPPTIPIIKVGATVTPTVTLPVTPPVISPVTPPVIVEQLGKLKGDDFTKVGLTAGTQTRLYDAKIFTYMEFLNTHEPELLAIDGITAENLPSITQAVAELALPHETK